MKYIFLSCLLGLLTSGFVRAQTPVDTLTNSSGKRVVLMSDKTWHFVGEKAWPKSKNNRESKLKTRKSSLPPSYSRKSSSSASYSASGYCGAPTKKGGSCRRKVKGGWLLLAAQMIL